MKSIVKPKKNLGIDKGIIRVCRSRLHEKPSITFRSIKTASQTALKMKKKLQSSSRFVISVVGNIPYCNNNQ